MLNDKVRFFVLLCLTLTLAGAINAGTAALIVWLLKTTFPGATPSFWPTFLGVTILPTVLPRIAKKPAIPRVLANRPPAANEALIRALTAKPDGTKN